MAQRWSIGKLTKLTSLDIDNLSSKELNRLYKFSTSYADKRLKEIVSRDLPVVNEVRNYASLKIAIKNHPDFTDDENFKVGVISLVKKIATSQSNRVKELRKLSELLEDSSLWSLIDELKNLDYDLYQSIGSTEIEEYTEEAIVKMWQRGSGVGDIRSYYDALKDVYEEKTGESWDNEVFEE